MKLKESPKPSGCRARLAVAALVVIAILIGVLV